MRRLVPMLLRGNAYLNSVDRNVSFQYRSTISAGMYEIWHLGVKSLILTNTLTGPF